jgi:hypothetical protein
MSLWDCGSRPGCWPCLEPQHSTRIHLSSAVQTFLPPSQHLWNDSVATTVHRVHYNHYNMDRLEYTQPVMKSYTK